MQIKSDFTIEELKKNSKVTKSVEENLWLIRFSDIEEYAGPQHLREVFGSIWEMYSEFRGHDPSSVALSMMGYVRDENEEAYLKTVGFINDKFEECFPGVQVSTSDDVLNRLKGL